MNKHAVGILIVIGALSMLGCSDFSNVDPSVGTGTIAGSVMDDQGNAISAANLFIKGNLALFTTSNPDGIFRLVDGAVGTRELVAYTENGIGASSEVKVFGQETTSITINLSPTATISGTVTLAGQNDHIASLVYLTGTTFVAFTDHTGAFTISIAIPGCHRLRAEHLGYIPKEFTHICVLQGETKILPEVTLLEQVGPQCTTTTDCGPGHDLFEEDQYCDPNCMLEDDPDCNGSCGNDVCEGDENPCSCEVACLPGDGSPGSACCQEEDCTSLSGECFEASCTDYHCDQPEVMEDCYGNQQCEAEENKNNCPEDC